MFRWLRRLLGVSSAYSEAEKKYGKKWYRSKTLWVNVIALLALVFDEKLGVPLSQDDQIALLATINVILRLMTREPVKW